MGSSSSGNHGPKEHGVLLYLSPTLQLGLCKLQVDKRLGKSYAGLLALTEGLHRLGCLNDVDYDMFRLRYSESMVNKVESVKSAEVVEAVNEQRKLEAQFSQVLVQWGGLKESARAVWIKKALEWKDKIPSAELVYGLVVKGEGVS